MMQHRLAEEFTPMRLAAQKGENNAIVSGALKTHMLMRKKEDCLNLPEKIRQTIDVDTGLTEDKEILRRGSFKAIMDHLMRIKRMSAEVKAKETVAFVTPLVESGKKVVVFSEHRDSLLAIYQAFAEQAVILSGETKPSERDTMVQRFQTDPECMVFCGQIKAAGVGITLTASSIVVFNDLTWLPADVAQATDRVHRIGQTGTVNVYYMVDPKLIIDTILVRILGNRSAEIASFEDAQSTILAEIQAWAESNA
jgi:SWI/SNF-related matrix-associated actin-dependent regulator 1 of chromatin subfamily A